MSNTKIHGYKLTEMSDHKFAKWLYNHDWDGDYEMVHEYNKFFIDDDCIAIVKYKNTPPTNRWIYLKESAV